MVFDHVCFMVPKSPLDSWSQQRASSGSSLIGDHTLESCSSPKQQCGYALRVSESRMCACCKNLIKRREEQLTPQGGLSA